MNLFVFISFVVVAGAGGRPLELESLLDNALRVHHVQTTHITTISSSLFSSTTVVGSTTTQEESTILLVSSTTTNSSVQAPTETAAQSTTSNPASRTWKVVGVSLIVVSLVAGTILIVVFFDHWSRFLRDLVLGSNSSAPAFEELVLDGEKPFWLADPFPTRPSSSTNQALPPH